MGSPTLWISWPVARTTLGLTPPPRHISANVKSGNRRVYGRKTNEENITIAFASALSRAHPDFDRAKFLAACDCD